MKFIFVCHNTHKTFVTEDFAIRDNKGVKEDENGNKTWDARVVLQNPCPLCGEIHEYQVCELSCPFDQVDMEPERKGDS